MNYYELLLATVLFKPLVSEVIAAVTNSALHLENQSLKQRGLVVSDYDGTHWRDCGSR
jgi:hypothetical protein